jgi:hypothetical protein
MFERLQLGIKNIKNKRNPVEKHECSRERRDFLGLLE